MNPLLRHACMVKMYDLNNPIERWALSVGCKVNQKEGFWGRFFSNFVRQELDVGLITFDEKMNALEYIYYDCLESRDQSISHSLRGHYRVKRGDFQAILVCPQSVDVRVKKMILVVSAFSGGCFKNIASLHCGVINTYNQSNIAFMDIDDIGAHGSVAIAQFDRVELGWHITSIDHRLKETKLPLIVRELRCLENMTNSG